MNVLGQQLMSHGAGVPTTRRIEMPFDTRQHGGVILDLSNRENKRCWGHYWSHACLSIKTKNKERKDSGVRGLKLQMGRTGKCKCKTKATYKKNKTGSETNKQKKFCIRRQFQAFFSVHQMQTISPGKSLKMEREKKATYKGKNPFQKKCKNIQKKCRTKFNHSKICKMPQNANKIHLHIYPPKNAVTGKKKVWQPAGT